jgi:hypothetical protein
MRKTLMLVSLALVLLIGLAVTINNVQATDSNRQLTGALKLRDDETEVQLSTPEIIFQEINNKALTSVKGGWLYVNEYQTHDVDPLPAVEGLLPLQDTDTDMWYYINSVGTVEQFVTIQRTINGQITQIGVYSNGTAWNTVVDEIIPMEPFSFEGIHYGLPGSHIKSPDITVNNLMKEGLNLTEFTIGVAEKEPVDILDYEKALVSIEHHYVFDASTGFLVSKRTIAHLEDGSQRELDNIQINVKLDIDPPPDVLEYFEMKSEREEQK